MVWILDWGLGRAADAVARAADFDTHLVVLPEMWTTGYGLDDGVIRELAEPASGPSIQEGQRIARDAGVALVLPFPELDPATDKVYNAAAVIDKNGTLLHVHRKTHLYGQFERDEFAASDELPGVVEVNGIKVGTIICYGSAGKCSALQGVVGHSMPEIRDEDQVSMQGETQRGCLPARP